MSGFLGLCFGILSSRVGPYNCTIVGLLLCGLGSVSGGYVDSFYALIATRIIEGIGFILAVVALPALIQKVTSPADRPIAMGIWGAFMPLGISVMLILSPSIIEYLDWRGLWIINGAIILVWCLLVGVMFSSKKDILQEQEKSSKQTMKMLLTTVIFKPQTIWMFMCFIVYSMLFISLISFLPTILVEQNSVSLRYAGQIGGIVVCGNIIGNYAAGILIKRGENPGTLLITGFVVMGLFSAFVFQPFLDPIAKLFCGLGFAISGGLIPGSLFVISSQLSSTEKPLVIFVGVLLQGAGIGQALGAYFTGSIVDYFGYWQAASFSTIFIMGFGLLFAYRLRITL